ncbi:hypothetical protein V499_04847 [Pseudogymnoascus sp. VKM F-103]|nr:hypothetical protein V499_04847 [Pseudogymnoascus sp. VKM F-103]
MSINWFSRGVIYALFGVPYVSGAILNVGSDKDYQTIGSTVSAAIEGDTIFVDLGVYREQVIIEQNNITLKGSTFPSENPFENSMELIHALYVSDGVGGQGNATLSVTGDIFHNVQYELYQQCWLGRLGHCSLYTRKQARFLFIVPAWLARYSILFMDFQQMLSFKVLQLEPYEQDLSQLKDETVTQQKDFTSLKTRLKVILGPNAASGTDGNSNLGRPWRDYARVVFQNSDFANVISLVGWQAWTSEQSTANVLFVEYNNVNPEWSSARVAFARKLDAPIDISTILNSTSWVDDKYLTIRPL